MIYCSASGWGTDGPYLKRPGQDLLVQSVSGAIMTSGKKSDGPVSLGTALCDQVNALNCVYAILAALYYREKTGKGQEIKTNLLSSAIAFQMQDGYIAIAMNSFEELVEALGDNSLLKYNDPQILFDKRDEIYYRIQEITVTKTTEEWLEIMLGLDLWVAQVNDQCDVADDPQVKHNNTFVEIDHPKAGKLTVTNIPFTMSETPGSIRRPSPLIGEHGPEILIELGYDENEIKRLIDEKIISVERTVISSNK